MLKNIVVLAAFVPFAAIAQNPLVVPAIDKTALVAPMDIGSSPIEISPKEREALNIAKAWKEYPDKPRRSADGTVMYLFGAGMPTLVCKERVSCIIRLQPGEILNEADQGDTRWDIGYSLSGSGQNIITNVIVKPLDTGLDSNVILTTDRRTYIVRLKSARHEWMPAIAFDYKEDQQAALAALYQRQERAVYGSTLSNGKNVDNLDFGYKITGDNVPWKPIRVYSDGKKTWMHFETIGTEAPAFVELKSKGGMFSDPVTGVMNNRFKGEKLDELEIDGVPVLSALIVGVGSDQKMVVIEKTGSKK